MNGFRFNEKISPGLPALRSHPSGYEYLPPSKALARGREGPARAAGGDSREQSSGSTASVQGRAEYLFSVGRHPDGDPEAEERQIRRPAQDNEAVYVLITWARRGAGGRGDSKVSISIYRLARSGKNNVSRYGRFGVERSRSTETARPTSSVRQRLRWLYRCKYPNWMSSWPYPSPSETRATVYFPTLFFRAAGLGINRTRPGTQTVGSSTKFWSVWKSCRTKADHVRPRCPSRSRGKKTEGSALSGDFAANRTYFEAWMRGNRIFRSRQGFFNCAADGLMEWPSSSRYSTAASKRSPFISSILWSSPPGADLTIRRGRAAQGRHHLHTQGSGKSLSKVLLARCWRSIRG